MKPLSEFGAREGRVLPLPFMETKMACHNWKPYNYEIYKRATPKLMTTLVVPIMNGQEFGRASVGVDINLETLQKTVKSGQSAAFMDGSIQGHLNWM